MVGNTLGPEQAYRFARGETVTSSTGLTTRLSRPLDWLVIADHSENLGLAPAIAESNPELLKNPWGKMEHDFQIYARQTSAAGLAAVWSRDNTREALWDAMKRKEVYATTGTRLRVRVFGGWDFAAADLRRSDFAKHGYAKGVPMGGDLKSAPAGKQPSLLIRAMRDADGANLDRMQIVKGWLDASGKTHEQVYDVVWSSDRKPAADGKLPPVGDTVNVSEASYTNAIGAPFLDAYWKDPKFDPAQRAFYYVRVLEIPTPRWTTYDAKIFKVALPKDVPASIQERAYTSPIWYTP